MTLPPGPSAPAAWQTVEWILRPTALLRRAAARHGEPFTLRTYWAGAPMVLVSHPDDVKRVFTAGPEELGGGGAALLAPFAGPSSILLLDGAEHLRQRRLMLPAFQGDRMRAYRPLVAELAERELAGWRGRVRTHERTQALTLEIIVRVVFGSDSPAVHAAIARALALTRSPPRLVAMALVQRDVGPYRAFRRAVAAVDAVIHDLIAAPSPPESVLALLKSARDEHGAPPTAGELRDQLVTLLAAGHETTAGALAWAFERLARHPRVLARLREGDPAYRDAVVREVLRVRPVLSVAPREVLAPFAIAGTTLPPGVQVAASIYLAHRRADSWGDPLVFRPERWLESDAKPYSWIPFGGGVRRCLGAAFATMEMGEVLRVAAQRDLFAPPAGERVTRRGVSLTPSRGGTVGVA